ncbi:MAG: hypothetical protein OXG96_09670 [Acidobacteria bacterium]|nr:hypothetical protein [Acidobacteriota bacterium]
MARAVPWVFSCLLVLFPGAPRLLAQTGAVEEPYQPPRGVFLPCGAADAAEVARMRLRVELPPVPAYPSNGEIPEELHDRLVYLDEETGELVLSFPLYPAFEGLGPRQELIGGRVVEKAPLGIASCPSLSVAIYQPGDPRTRGYVYRYRIQNRLQARKSIGQILLPVPLKQQEMGLSGLVRPHGWGVDDWELPEARVEERSKAMSSSWGEDYRREVRHSMLRRRINWHAQLTQYTLAQGKALEPFGFTTEALPGIVRAYVVGSPSVISTRSNWVEELRGQKWAFNFSENNSLSISTIGPKFPPDADKRLIASDFLGSLEELIRTGEMEGESPFIQKVLPLLETVAGGVGEAVEAAVWPSETETDFEAEILMALRLSLGE